MSNNKKLMDLAVKFFLVQIPKGAYQIYKEDIVQEISILEWETKEMTPRQKIATGSRRGYDFMKNNEWRKCERGCRWVKKQTEATDILDTLPRKVTM